MTEAANLGRQIARYRKIRGLTQVQLAMRAHVSISMLTKVESGHASPSEGWVAAVARHLGIDAVSLYSPIEDAAAVPIGITVDRLRLTLVAGDLVDDDLILPPLAALEGEVAQVGEWRRAATYSRIAPVLPELIRQLVAGAPQYGERTYVLLAYVYRAANSLAHKFGYTDLSLTAIERMAWAAERSGSELLGATTQYLRAEALGRIGADVEARKLLLTAASPLEAKIGKNADAAAVYSRLHTYLGMTAARQADAVTAIGHLNEAASVVVGTGDRVVHESAVGPTSVEVFRLGAAVILKNPGSAIAIGKQIRFNSDVARERQAFYWIDMARAHMLNNDSESATTALLEARGISPEHFAASSTARGAVQMLIDKQRRPDDRVRSLLSSARVPRK